YLSLSELTVSFFFGPARLIHSARSRWPELRTPKIPSGLRTVAPSDFSPPEPSSRRLSLLAVRLRRLRTSREVLVQRGTAKAQLSLREAALTGFIVSLPQAVRQRRGRPSTNSARRQETYGLTSCRMDVISFTSLEGRKR